MVLSGSPAGAALLPTCLHIVPSAAPECCLTLVRTLLACYCHGLTRLRTASCRGGHQGFRGQAAVGLQGKGPASTGGEVHCVLACTLACLLLRVASRDGRYRGPSMQILPASRASLHGRVFILPGSPVRCLPGLQVPTQVFVTDSLPKGPTGKISRRFMVDAFINKAGGEAQGAGARGGPEATALL